MKTAYLAGKDFDAYGERLFNLDNAIWREVQGVIVDFRPSVVGISSKTHNLGLAGNVARITKRIDPDFVVILGGPHASMVPAEVLAEYEGIDISIKGEGKETFSEILQAIGAR